jgi:subtilase family serine protease
MRTRLLFSVVTAALLMVAFGGTAVHAATIDLGPVTVTQNLLPGLAAATDIGAADPATPMKLALNVARPDPAGEQALLDAENDPSSPSYGQFLSPDDFATRFGVPQSRVDAVTSWLSGGGLSVDSVSAARDIIAVHGTVAQVSALLSTPIHRFSYNGVAFLANTAAPVIPLSLGITNVIGLNTLQRYTTPAGAQQDTCLTQGTCIGITTPADLWGVYRQPAAYQGQGQSIAIFGEGQTAGVVSDLRAFETQHGLPQIPVTIKHPAGDTDFSDDAGHVEWNIDTQASTGMAPQAANLTLYFGQDLSDADVTKVMSQWTDDRHGPMQASASYGECETVPVVSPIAGQPLLIPVLPAGQGLGNNVDATETQILRQAAIEGKTLFASTGDTGSSCPVVFAAVIGAGNGVVNQGAPITNSPASLPYVVGVGGTVLYTDGQGHRDREYGWNYSGGGSTLFTPAPSYQRGTQGLSYPCITDPQSICRGIADVSAQSGDILTNGYAIISAGQASVGGGTSLSSPLWEGMWVRIQGASPHTKGNGFANYALYRVGNNAGSYPRDFFDITSTDPATGLPSTNGAYPILPGWDYVTGFGTPKVDGLICDIDGKGC